VLPFAQGKKPLVIKIAMEIEKWDKKKIGVGWVVYFVRSIL